MAASRLEALLAEKARREAATAEMPLEQDSIAPPANPRLEALMAEKARRQQAANNEPWTAGQRALQAGHGVANAYESIADMPLKGMAGALTAFGSGVKAMNKHVNPESEQGLRLVESEREREKAITTLNKPRAKGVITNRISDLAGRELTPTEDDKLGKFIHTAGEFAAPLPGGGLINSGKIGVRSLARHVRHDLATATGASAALNLTPSMTEEGTVGRVAEDIGKTILGGKAGRGLTRVKDLPAKAMAFRANPNEEVFKLAEKHGVELPFNVGMGSRPANFTANNYLDSIFARDRYQKVFTNAAEKMLDKVKGVFNTLGKKELKPSEASTEFKNFMYKDRIKMEKEGNKLYLDARNLLTPKDKIVPQNTINALKGAAEELKSDFSVPGKQKVANIIHQIIESWGISPKGLPKGKGKVMKTGDVDPKYLEQILGQISSGKPINTARLDKLVKDLKKTIDYDMEVRGEKGFLKKLIAESEKDLLTSGNPEYLAKRKEATQFWAENVAARFRGQTGKSILKRDAPTEAFNLMTSPDKVRRVEAIIGKTKEGQQAFNSLKRAKLIDIFDKAIEDESIRATPFANIFSKKSKQQEMIETLVGKKSYKELAEIAKIAKAFKQAGRELLNTSRSAVTHADFTRGEKLLKSIISTFVGSSAGLGAAGLPGALAGPAGPYILSHVASNPKWVRQARQYALAKQKGNEKYANTLWKGLVDMTMPTMKDAENIGVWNITRNEKGTPVVMQNPKGGK